MNTTDLIFHLQDSLVKQAYSTTYVHQNETHDAIIVFDAVDEGDFFIEVRVDDPESPAFKIVRFSRNRVIQSEASLSGLPLYQVAQIVLTMIDN